MTAERQIDARMAAFERECVEAGTKPEDVLAEAGIHRSAWFRWKNGAVSPTLRNWDKAQEALDRIRKRRAAA